MKARPYTRFMAWFYAVGAVALLISPLFNHDEDQWVIAPLVALVLGYRSWSCFRQLKYIHKEDKVYEPPVHSSISEKIKYYERMFWIGLVAFAGLSVIIILDLNELESGKVEYVKVVQPIAFFYKIGGYWLAILTLPVLGSFMLLLMQRKLQKMKQEEKEQQP